MFTRYGFALGLLVVFVISASAKAVLIQPSDAQSHDVFLYQGTPTFNYNGAGGFGAYLGSADSDGGGHDAQSLIRFDLTGQSIPVGGKAFLGLYVTTSPGIPSVDPSDSLTTVTDVFPVNDSWDENSATWDSTRTLAGNVGAIAAQTTIGATGKYYEFDVTSAVAAWIADPSSNLGFFIRADAPFANGIGAVFYESAGGDNRPYINIVPEPVAIAALAPMILLGLGRRRT